MTPKANTTAAMVKGSRTMASSFLLTGRHSNAPAAGAQFERDHLEFGSALPERVRLKEPASSMFE
jgi:hypothetical protein